MRKRKAQSTLEYVIVLTAIVAAIILAATKFIQPRVENSLDTITQKMTDQIGKVSFSN